MTSLELQNVDVGYNGIPVAEAVSFALERGEIGCLLGPSGCGKTTLLRAMAGFERVLAGRILIEGREVGNPAFDLPPEKREVGMVFQDYALFPHLSVADNIGFGIHQWQTAERKARVDELLQLVGLPSYGKTFPHALSGGQQQRVALARALAPRPRVLLLDEPFSNMDTELREALAREVRGILKKENITAVLVTHDQFEAFAIADRIGVMHAGRVQQWDTAFNLYHRPANRFVADFIGQGVLLEGKVEEGSYVRTAVGVIEGRTPPGCCSGCPVDVLVRPDDILHDDDSPLQGEVVAKAFRGAAWLYTLKLPDGTRLLSLASSHHDHPLGSRIGIRLDFDHLIIFPREACPTYPTGAVMPICHIPQ